ncbi:MAG TPA: ABC transporter ATP-binding protein [Chloroflexota bacterium]|jgi:peptide/nickel transport system ATP-binding protein|nr:ABC transporter ATP-binding protein [Chloroflexota bacterium]
MTGQPLLDVRDLAVAIGRQADAPRVVDGVSLTVGRGEIVGLVGESGCGKSMSAFAIAGLFPTPAARVVQGSVLLAGRDLTTLDARARRATLGKDLGMVFQDPSSFLDPLMRVGDQVAESLRVRGQNSGAWTRVVELLALMELPEPRETARRYPHELSGGQRQRVLIAAALALQPSLLIADEPTTALDTTVQASILDLLLKLRRTLQLSVLLITHDLGVIAETCDRVYVMYAGRVVETNTTEQLFRAPRHPYTRGLLRGTLAVETQTADLFSIPGTVPDLRHMPSGCRFHPRCPLAIEVCVTRDPPLTARRDLSGADACWRAQEPAAAHVWEDVTWSR